MLAKNLYCHGNCRNHICCQSLWRWFSAQYQFIYPDKIRNYRKLEDSGSYSYLHPVSPGHIIDMARRTQAQVALLAPRSCCLIWARNSAQRKVSACLYKEFTQTLNGSNDMFCTVDVSGLNQRFSTSMFSRKYSTNPLLYIFRVQKH